MRVRVDSALCQGHGFCYANAPDLFDDDDTGHSVVKVLGELTASQEEAAQSASWLCPELAIQLIE